MNRVRRAYVALIAAGLLGGCVLGLPKGPEANETDAERLAIVQQDPLLRNARVITEAGPARTSGNVLTWRWQLSESFSFDTSETDSAPTMWEISKSYVDEVLASGWKITAAQCDPSGSITILALRDFGEFTSAMIMVNYMVEHDLRVFIPFHTEPVNPWDPGVPLPKGSTCAERDQPPTADEGALPENDNYDRDLGQKVGN